MTLKAFLIASLLSVPLLPILVLDTGTLNEFISQKDAILAAPFFIELFILYAIYQLCKDNKHISDAERKALYVYAFGMFGLFSIPVVTWQIVNPLESVSTIGFLALVLYALANITILTTQLGRNKLSIKQVFIGRLVYPGIISLGATLLFLYLEIADIDAMALYFIIRNYTANSKFVY